MIVIQGGSLSTVTCPLSYPVLENIRKVLGVTYSSPTLPFRQLHNIEWCCLEALYQNTFTSQWRCVLRQRRRGTWTVIYIKYFCYLWEIFLHPTVCVRTGPLRRRGEGGLLRTSPLMTTSSSDTAPTSDTGAGIRPLLSRWDWLHHKNLTKFIVFTFFTRSFLCLDSFSKEVDIMHYLSSIQNYLPQHQSLFLLKIITI